LESFIIDHVTGYEDVPFLDAMERLAEATQEYYTDIRGVEKYILDLRATPSEVE
jgi:hypothetical protein